MTDQKARVIWVYGPDGAEKDTYITKKLSSIGYHFSEILLVSSDDFREMGTIDSKKKVLLIKNVRHEWPDEELISVWVRNKELYSVRKSFYDYKFELTVFASLYSPHELYLKSLALRKKIYEGEVLRLEENKPLRRKLERMFAEGKISPSELFEKTEPIIYRETD